MIRLIVRSSGKVDIHGGPGQWRPPGREQQGTFQNEPICIRGFCEPIQKSLHRKILEQFLKWPALRARLVEG